MRSRPSDSITHSTPKARAWQACLLAPGVLLLLTLVYFWPQLGGGKVLYWGDVGLYFTPMAVFLKDNLAVGHVPLWNPLIYCGTPYIGNPQTWPLYPVTALLPFVSAPYFLGLTVALHVWLAGIGTYLFARRALGVGRAAALLAAVTFMFGGQLVSKEQFPNMVQAAAWLPWVLWALDRLLHERRVRHAAVLGLILGMQLLAAHPQMTTLTLYLAAAWGVFVRRSQPASLPPFLVPAPVSDPLVPEKQGRARRPVRLLPPRDRRLAGLLAFSFAIALGLAAGQILPTLAMFRDASRQKLSFGIVNRFTLPGREVGNFILPHLHGQPLQGTFSGGGNYWESCCYVGVLSFGLAAWAAFAAWRRGARPAGAQPARFWTGVFVIGVWMAWGGKAGLYHLAYWVLPAFRAFHDPARCLLWACFALSLLAAWGWEHVPNRGGKTAWAALVLLLAFADLTYFGRTIYPLAYPATLFPVAPNVALLRSDPDVRAHQARVLAPTAGVWARFTTTRNYRQTVPGYQTLWADSLTPNLMMPYGLRDAFGYEPVALKNAQVVDEKASKDFDPKAEPQERAAAAGFSGALGVKYVAVCRVTPPEPTAPGLVAVRAAPTLATPDKEDEAQAFIYLSRNTRWQPRARLERSAAPVTIGDDGPDRVTLTCATAGAARLILADTQAAGWRAAADGRPAPIEAYGGSLRAVRLAGAGTHTVVFSYVPTAYLLGLYLSLLTLAGLAGAGAFAAARNFARFGRNRGRRRGIAAE